MVVAANGRRTTVVGATGAQGASVVDALIASTQPYAIRGLTRDAESASSKRLADQGVELSTASITEPEGIAKAIDGAEIVFVVTPPTLMREEDSWGRKWIDAAAKSSSLKLFVFSALDSIAECSNGKYTGATHFDHKAALGQYAIETLGADRVALVQPGGYFENYNSPGPLGLKKRDDGSYYINAPRVDRAERPLPVLFTRGDYGLWVQAAIERRSEAGTKVLAASEALTHDELAQQIGAAVGKQVDVQRLPYDQYVAAMPERMGPFRNSFTDMMFGVAEAGYFADSSGPIGKAHGILARQPLTFAQWAKQADWSGVL